MTSIINNNNNNSSSGSVHVTIVSDVVCPFCFIGLRNMQKASASTGIPITIEWEPFLLDSSGNIPEEGIPVMTVLTKKYGPQTAKQLLDSNSSLNRAGRAVGIEFCQDRNSYPTIKAHVVMEYVKETYGNVAANKVMEELFERYFVAGDNINSNAVLTDVVSKFGGSIDVASLNTEARRRRIYEADSEYKKKRVSGVPYFIIKKPNGKLYVKFSGAQPIEAMAEVLQEAYE